MEPTLSELWPVKNLEPFRNYEVLDSVKTDKTTSKIEKTETQ